MTKKEGFAALALALCLFGGLFVLITIQTSFLTAVAIFVLIAMVVIVIGRCAYILSQIK